MRGRLALFIVLNFMLLSLPISASGQSEAPSWRSVGLDPESWTDGPVEEDTPMKSSYQGNAVFVIEVTYHTTLTSDEYEGNITIELFEQWAPITTNNIIEHIETGLYDGIFFHRVIDDFVIQSGDPECKTVALYPATSPQCGSGGTGETIPLEHDENLSHVDGAIGMARDTDPDSADSQWYIAETEAHGLDPENRDDGGYAVFGIVRDGMSHVREIANTPTTGEPTGDEDIQNPAPDLLGRPLREVHIESIQMIGVADPDGTIRFGVSVEESEPLITGAKVGFALFILLLVALFYISRVDPPESLEKLTIVTYDAVLVEDEIEDAAVIEDDDEISLEADDES